MTPFSLPHLGIFDLSAFRPGGQGFASLKRREEAETSTMSDPVGIPASDDRTESSRIYLWSFFPLF
ncbi:hypothetical protein J2858_004402 [Neorhizobium galegae]|uniref:hypothetical protein n=1 Tax=Neorhizobium galegae TaxID=399 RepID=UPI001AE556DF|nr:hypothetical protein [Neorhizobium galegae]MBP2551460.1 hypothetical protein [Neorhizobium galegae]